MIVADDARQNLDVVTRILKYDGYTVYTARDGVEAVRLTFEEAPDVVVTDVMMPGLTGFEVCRQIKAGESTRLTPVVLLTGFDSHEDRLEGINAGADDFLTKPVNASELRARVRSLVRLKRFTDNLDSAETLILSLALTVEARDPYTGGHCARMSALAREFGTHLGLPDDDVSTLTRAGYLHDVGKIAVPDAVLLKGGRLSPAEFDVMKQHTVTGDHLCGRMKLLRPVKPIVRSHHERLNGSGYPDGLSGGAIPLLAQIIGIVDVYDALTTRRPYRSALAPDAALAVLESEVRRGMHSPSLVREFTEMIAA